MVNRILIHGSTPLPHSVARSLVSGEETLSIVRDRETVHELANGTAAFVPEFYEANYPYPLLVWLSRGDATLGEFHRRMSGVSTRNVLGLSVPVHPGSEVRTILDAVRNGVRDLRRTWHVHTERIVLAGAGSLGDAALRTFLERPEWFAAAVVLRGRFAQALRLPIRNVSLRGKRVLFVGCDESRQPQRLRLLQAAGLEATVRRSAAAALADVNAWIMAGVCVAA